jgi:hypothetical protein
LHNHNHANQPKAQRAPSGLFRNRDINDHHTISSTSPLLFAIKRVVIHQCAGNSSVQIRTEKAAKMRTTAVLKNAARTPLIKFLGKRTTPGKTKFTHFDVVRDVYTAIKKLT